MDKQEMVQTRETGADANCVGGCAVVLEAGNPTKAVQGAAQKLVQFVHITINMPHAVQPGGRPYCSSIVAVQTDP